MNSGWGCFELPSIAANAKVRRGTFSPSGGPPGQFLGPVRAWWRFVCCTLDRFPQRGFRGEPTILAVGLPKNKKYMHTRCDFFVIRRQDYGSLPVHGRSPGGRGAKFFSNLKDGPRGMSSLDRWALFQLFLRQGRLWAPWSTASAFKTNFRSRPHEGDGVSRPTWCTTSGKNSGKGV